MDLGKMLAEAMTAAETDAEGYPNGAEWVEGYFDLTAAAEAFLAKVREAEKPTIVSEIAMRHDGQSPTMTIDLRFPSHGMAVSFYNQTVRRRRETSLRLHLQADRENTGPVPYRGEVR